MAYTLTFSSTLDSVTVNGNAVTSPYTLQSGDVIVANVSRTQTEQPYIIVQHTETETISHSYIKDASFDYFNTSIKLDSGFVSKGGGVRSDVQVTINYTEIAAKVSTVLYKGATLSQKVISADEAVNILYNGTNIGDMYLLGVKKALCARHLMNGNLQVGDTILNCNNKYMEDNVQLQLRAIQKGDLITMNLDGTSRNYRVLSINGTKVKCMAMFDATSIAFGSSQVYANNTLDNYMENTWYAGLTTTAKYAIDAVTFTQDKWYSDPSVTPTYPGTYKPPSESTSYNYWVSLANSAYGSVITRHVYALSVQDVVDYLEVKPDPEMTSSNTTLTYDNIRTMFWNDTSVSSGNIWLRSANDEYAIAAWDVEAGLGMLSDTNFGYSLAARPAFIIDFSRMDESLITTTTPDVDDEPDIN